MFVGHFGLAFALKRVEPRLSLVTLTVATVLVDIFWVLFVTMGWEQVRIVPGYAAASHYEFVSYPLTHSLMAAVVWALIAGVAYYSWPTKDTSHHRRRAIIVALAVASHYFLDLPVHLPDLPIAGDDSPKLGFGLWRSIPATAAIELGFLFGGLALLLFYHSRHYRPRRLRLVLLALLLAAAFLGGFYAPPENSVREMVLGSSITLGVILALVYWADRPFPDAAARVRH
jgi:hypothetical protein